MDKSKKILFTFERLNYYSNMNGEQLIAGLVGLSEYIFMF